MLEATPAVSSPQATVTARSIVVQVPTRDASTWASTDEVGIQGYQPALGSGKFADPDRKGFCLPRWYRGAERRYLSSSPSRDEMLTSLKLRNKSMSQTSVNTISPIDRDELVRLSEKGKGNPGAVRTLKVKTVLESKFRHLNYIRSLAPHVIDEPPGLLGDDTAPNPSEAVLAALGSCLSVGIQTFA
jgi:hypothetical protein